jgi:hypothetical protein
MNDQLPLCITINQNGIFYSVSGNVCHFVARAAITELYLVQDRLFVLTTSNVPDVTQFRCTEEVARFILDQLKTEGWPEVSWQKIEYCYDLEDDPIPFQRRS